MLSSGAHTAAQHDLTCHAARDLDCGLHHAKSSKVFEASKEMSAERDEGAPISLGPLAG